MHEHNECEHELKYCKKCDTVYCELCKKEWKNFIIHYNQTWYPLYNDDPPPKIKVNECHYSNNTA